MEIKILIDTENKGLNGDAFEIPMVKNNSDLPDILTTEIGIESKEYQEDANATMIEGAFYRRFDYFFNIHKFTVDRLRVRGEFKLTNDELYFIGLNRKMDYKLQIKDKNYNWKNLLSKL